MADGKVLAITGIPGVGTSDFCDRYSAIPGLKTKVYSTADLMYESANRILGSRIPLENLLNLSEPLRKAILDRAFDHVVDRLPEDRKAYDSILIDTHAQFMWNDVLWDANDWSHLSDVGADMYLNLIDKPSSIKARQLGSTLGRREDHDLRSLLLWQDAEVNITKGWASNYRKPMYVLPSAQDPLTVEALLKSAFLIYYQMPMTDASSKENDQISAFKARILETGKEIYGLPTPLIDPRDIDIETGAELSESEKRAIRIQTVHRDMDWYIGEVTTLVAFYPEGAPLSKGVSDESTRGHETGKDAFIIYSKEFTSPFMDLSKGVFRSADEFLTFFPEYMRRSVEFHKRAD
jgi:adenylate kinase